jgi:hypothetical protein
MVQKRWKPGILILSYHASGAVFQEAVDHDAVEAG